MTKQSLHALPSAGRIINVRHDASANALVVGYATGSLLYSSTAPSGYGIASFAY